MLVITWFNTITKFGPDPRKDWVPTPSSDQIRIENAHQWPLSVKDALGC